MHKLCGESVKFTWQDSHQPLPHMTDDQLNVVLVLDNNIKKNSHVCYLSTSPMMKEILINIEVRLEKHVTISLPGYSEKCVEDFLKFLHEGSVEFTNLESQLDFLTLCQNLKLNPPVNKQYAAFENQMPQQCEERIQETNLEKEPPTEIGHFPDVPDVVSQQKSLCDQENNYLRNLKSPGGTSSKSDSEEDEETPELISDFLRDLNKMNEDVVEKMAEHEGEDEETPEALEDNTELLTASVLEPADTFKMPDSFDLPTDFIKEILPTNKASFSANPLPLKGKEQSKKMESNNESTLTGQHPSTKNDSSPSCFQVKPSTSRDRETEKTSVSFVPKPSSLKPSTSEAKGEARKEINFDKLTMNTTDDKRPVQETVTPITYAKDSKSKRNQGIQGKINPLRDRRKFMASVFGSESDEEGDSEREPSKRSDSSSKLENELEEKKRRMQEKLENKWKRRSSKKHGPRDIMKRNEDDDNFIVSDNDELYKSSSESNSSSEDDQDGRRKRLHLRKKKKGGDVLSWMSRRAKISVTVQTRPKEYIQDMAQYRLKLLGDADSDDTGNDDSLSRKFHEETVVKRKRIRTMETSSSETEEDTKRDKFKKFRKLKEKTKSKVDSLSKASFPVDDVIWTPSMYQKWDKISNKPPKEKSKDYSRSTSVESKSPKQSNSLSLDKFKRSISSIESSKVNMKMYPSPSSSSSLPKIPKLVKKDS